MITEQGKLALARELERIALYNHAQPLMTSACRTIQRAAEQIRSQRGLDLNSFDDGKIFAMMAGLGLTPSSEGQEEKFKQLILDCLKEDQQ
jgi:hypothetical protein